MSYIQFQFFLVHNLKVLIKLINMLIITFSHKIRRKFKVNIWNLQVFYHFFIKKTQKTTYFRHIFLDFALESTFFVKFSQHSTLWRNLLSSDHLRQHLFAVSYAYLINIIKADPQTFVQTYSFNLDYALKSLQR